jgi:DNA-binding NarL/FixJ family response regulator
MAKDARVFVFASDPVTAAGIGALLDRLDFEAVSAEEVDAADLAIVCCDRVNDEVLRIASAVQRSGRPSVMLIITTPDQEQVASAAGVGVTGFLRRDEVTQVTLQAAVRAVAAGEGWVPPDLLGELLRRVGGGVPTSRAPVRSPQLSEREVAVLRLVGDGKDTREIARELCYSERTVKNVLQNVTTRLGLRNRSHALAYALREGLI